MPSTRSLAISALLATAALAAPARETERDTNIPAPAPAPTTIIRPSWTQEDYDRWMSALIVGYAGVEIETFPSEPTKTIMHKAGVARTVASDLGLPTPDLVLPTPLWPYPNHCPEGTFPYAGGCWPIIADAGIEPREAGGPWPFPPSMWNPWAGVEIETFPSEPTKTVMHKAGVARTVASDLVLPTGMPWVPGRCLLMPSAPGCQPETPDAAIEPREPHFPWKGANPGWSDVEIETFPSEPTKTVMHKAGVARTVAPDLVPTGMPGLPDVCWLAPFYPGCQLEMPDAELSSIFSKIHYPTPTTLQTMAKPTQQADAITKKPEAPEPTEMSRLPPWWPIHEYDRCAFGGPFDEECEKHFKHQMESLSTLFRSKAMAMTAPTVSANAQDSQA